VTRIGVGYGNGGDARELGRSIAESALKAGGIGRPNLVLAFSHGSVDSQAFYDGLRSMVGADTPIVGGSGLGVITQDALSYDGSPAAAAVIESDTIDAAVSSAGGLDADEAAAARRMVKGLSASSADRALLLFYDSVRVPPGAANPAVLNSSSPLLEGIEAGLRSRVPVFGAGLVGDYAFSPTHQYCGWRVDRQNVVGCMLSGHVTPYCAVMHGCIPLDGVYRTITRMDGNIVYELDGRPVVELIDGLFGGTEWQNDRPVVCNVTFGVNYGERFGPPHESAYVNRLITGVLPDRSGVGMFEADLRTGQEIQFLVRDNRSMARSVRDNVPALLARIEREGRRPILGLYIDCGGRTSVYSMTEEEEAATVQRILGEAGVPLLGFYSGVEIAPMLGRSRGLDWTGVLVILTEDVR